jgi:hypothetical protein
MICIMTTRGWRPLFPPLRPGADPDGSDPSPTLTALNKYKYDRGFISGSVDMRTIPMKRHPETGKLHYNHGFWP